MQKIVASKRITHSRPTGKLIFIKRSDLEDFIMKNPIHSEDDIDSIVADNLLMFKTNNRTISTTNDFFIKVGTGYLPTYEVGDYDLITIIIGSALVLFTIVKGLIFLAKLVLSSTIIALSIRSVEFAISKILLK